MRRVRKASSNTPLDFLNKKEKSVRETYAIKSMAVSNYIEAFKESNKDKQKEIADKLEMAESQLSKWFSGEQNLTLQSILKLESACSIEIINPAIWEGTSFVRKNLEQDKDKSFSISLDKANDISYRPLHAVKGAKSIRGMYMVPAEQKTADKQAS